MLFDQALHPLKTQTVRLIMTMSRKIGLFVIISKILLCSCSNEEPDPLVVSSDNKLINPSL
jgi:hypothetical protein